ncbi:MAG: SPOR domain-containing protein [Terriglobales bacterium]
MTTAEQDTEITLGTGRMLAIFFAFVLVCAFFFSIGFSLGRRTASAGVFSSPGLIAGAPATVVRPTAAKNNAALAAPQTQASSQSNDFSFYKAVGEKSADASLKPADQTTQTAVITPTPANSGAEAAPKGATDATAAPESGGYFVQVAAVSRQEDAESLVEALKKKQYPAFTANNSSADKFFHVQVGPYGELKDAEAMRARLIGDGYNPIVKK